LQSLVVLALAIAVHVMLTAAASPFIPDDSFISFRYAENLAAGKGLRFNDGDPPVEGYSNLLWIILCAALHKGGADLPTVTPNIGRLFGVLSLAVLYLIYVRRNLSPFGMLGPLLLTATSGPLVIYAVSGLETTLFAFLLLVLLLTYDRLAERKGITEILALVLAGFLLALCRPEGVVALPVLVAFKLFALKRGVGERTTKVALVSTAAAFGVLYCAYTAWRVAYFDALVPIPFLSKGGGTLTSAWVANFHRDFWRQRSEYPQIGYYVVALVALAVAGAIRRRVPSKGSAEMAALTLVLVYVGVYLNFVDWMPGMRYHAALVPLLFVPIAQLSAHTNYVDAVRKQRTPRARHVLLVVAAVFASLCVFVELKRVARNIEESNRFCLLPLAKWIAAYTPPHWKIAMSDVGAVPYYSKRYTMDIHPRPLTDYDAARKGWSEDYFYSKKPEVIILVSRGVYTPKMFPEHAALTQTARFDHSYRFVGAVRKSWQQARSYWVYFPKDSAPVDSVALAEFPVGIGPLGPAGR
jgi:hypothetical protein